MLTCKPLHGRLTEKDADLAWAQPYLEAVPRHWHFLWSCDPRWHSGWRRSVERCLMSLWYRWHSSCRTCWALNSVRWSL